MVKGTLILCSKKEIILLSTRMLLDAHLMMVLETGIFMAHIHLYSQRQNMEILSECISKIPMLNNFRLSLSMTLNQESTLEQLAVSLICTSSWEELQMR